MAHIIGFGDGDVQFAPGDFYKPKESSDVVKTMARGAFLDAFARIYPAAMAELESEVFPVYVELCKAIGRPPDDYGDADNDLYHMEFAGYIPPPRKPNPRLEARQAAYLARPGVQARLASGEMKLADPDEDQKGWYLEHLPMKEAFFGWCERYRLSESWMHRAILSDFHFFYRDSARPEAERLGLPLGHRWPRSVAFGDPITEEENLFDFKFEDGWNPLLNTWKGFEEGLRKAFEAHLSEYRRGLEAFLFELGYERTPVKRNAYQHLDMLVLRIVEHASWSAIADLYQVEAVSVREAVTRTSKLADIPLPQIRSGRPARSRPA